MKGLKFIRQLGHGVNSTVWLVMLNNRKYALKRFKVFDYMSYINEVQLQSVIACVNLAPRIYKHEIFEGRNDTWVCYILMEYLDKFVRLCDLLYSLEKDNKMSSNYYKRLCKIYQNASNVLKSHEMKIEDLQCMVNKNNLEWKIIDFGLATMM